MSLADRVKEARGKLKPAELARRLGVSKAAVSLIEDGTTKTLRHETALAMQRVTGYRAEYLATGAPPKKVSEGDASEAMARTSAEEMMLFLFRGLTQPQQRELALEVKALVDGNREIQQRFLDKPLRTYSNEDVEAAFGKTPTPSKPTKKPRRRPGFAEEDPE